MTRKTRSSLPKSPDARDRTMRRVERARRETNRGSFSTPRVETTDKRFLDRSRDTTHARARPGSPPRPRLGSSLRACRVRCDTNARSRSPRALSDARRERTSSRDHPFSDRTKPHVPLLRHPRVRPRGRRVRRRGDAPRGVPDAVQAQARARHGAGADVRRRDVRRRLRALPPAQARGHRARAEARRRARVGAGLRRGAARGTPARFSRTALPREPARVRGDRDPAGRRGRRHPARGVRGDGRVPDAQSRTRTRRVSVREKRPEESGDERKKCAKKKAPPRRGPAHGAPLAPRRGRPFLRGRAERARERDVRGRPGRNRRRGYSRNRRRGGYSRRRRRRIRRRARAGVAAETGFVQKRLRVSAPPLAAAMRAPARGGVPFNRVTRRVVFRDALGRVERCR